MKIFILNRALILASLLISLAFFVFHLHLFRESNKVFSNASEFGFEEKQQVIKLETDILFNTHPKYGSLNYILSTFNELSVDERILFLEKSLMYNPNHFESLISVAELLLHKRHDIKAAKEYLLRAQVIQSNYFKVNLMLAEINISEHNYEEARKLIDSCYHPWYKIQINLLERMIYRSDYLEQITNSNISTQDSLSKIDLQLSNSLLNFQDGNYSYSKIAGLIHQCEKLIFQKLDSVTYHLYLEDQLNCRISQKSDLICRQFGINGIDRNKFLDILFIEDVRMEYDRRKLRYLEISEKERIEILHSISDRTSNLVVNLKFEFKELRVPNFTNDIFNWNWYFQSE